jgi:hypothetical protein
VLVAGLLLLCTDDVYYCGLRYVGAVNLHYLSNESYFLSSISTGDIFASTQGERVSFIVWLAFYAALQRAAMSNM